MPVRYLEVESAKDTYEVKVDRKGNYECFIEVMTSMTLIGGWTLVPALAWQVKAPRSTFSDRAAGHIKCPTPPMFFHHTSSYLLTLPQYGSQGAFGCSCP
jgi:hypothetical protein